MPRLRMSFHDSVDRRTQQNHENQILQIISPDCLGHRHLFYVNVNIQIKHINSFQRSVKKFSFKVLKVIRRSRSKLVWSKLQSDQNVSSANYISRSLEYSYSLEIRF
jgi:hypothetical protein